MLPCYFYTKNYEKTPKSCIDYVGDSEQANWFSQCVKDTFGETKKYCDCPHFAECVKLAGETYRSYKNVNTVVNYFGDGQYDIVRYKEPFRALETVVNDTSDKSRKFVKVFDDVLVPLTDSATISSLQKTIARASKRAQDNYFGYALTNTWTHFFTFTFSPDKVDKFNDDTVKMLWADFRRKLQRYDAGIKILCVPERHKNGALHFHTLMSFSHPIPIVDYGNISKYPTRTNRRTNQTGFCTYTETGSLTVRPLTQYRNYFMPYYEYGKIKYSKSGAMLFAPSFYDFGLATCAILPEGEAQLQAIADCIGSELDKMKILQYCSQDRTEQQIKVINYLITYTTKESNLGYGNHRYYRTNNLSFKNKLVMMLSDEDFDELTQSLSMSTYKDRERFTVHRNFNNRKES